MTYIACILYSFSKEGLNLDVTHLLTLCLVALDLSEAPALYPGCLLPLVSPLLQSSPLKQHQDVIEGRLLGKFYWLLFWKRNSFKIEALERKNSNNIYFTFDPYSLFHEELSKNAHHSSVDFELLNKKLHMDAHINEN